MTYKFPQFNLEIVNPTIEVDKVVNDLNPDTMTLTANVVLVVDSARFGVGLTDVTVTDLNYNYDQLCERVLAKLKDYEI